MRVAALFFLLLMSLWVSAKDSIGVVEAQYNKFVGVDDASFGGPEPERLKLLEDTYTRLFERRLVDPSRASDSDITFLFRAAQRIHFYTQQPRYSAEMARYLALMEKRHIATPNNRLDYYRSLIAERRFDDARQYAQASGVPTDNQPSLVQEPKGGVDSSPAVLELDSDGKVLKLRQVEVKDLHVVVVVTPWCHFARNGVRAIESDSEVMQALKGQTVWLMPVEGNLDTKTVRSWNSEHPQQSMVYAYKKSDWSMLPEWGTPTFYFFSNGKVVGQFAGWRSDGEGLAGLRDNLRKIGLMK